MKRIAVIGGGAAGLCFAVMLKNLDASINITVFEALDRVGKKLATTGNGRCNITNLDLFGDRYHGDSGLATKLLSDFGYKNQQDFFKELGVLFVAPEDNRVYPMSLQASSVVDALRFAAMEKGVEILVNTRVHSVGRADKGFIVSISGENQNFDAVVVATGGKAGGKLGSEDGYAILKFFGHKIEGLSPSIVQIKTEPQLVRQLKGIKVDANVTITSDEGSRTDFGEVLFCDYGLSGPPVLQVSRLANAKNACVSLDLLPNWSAGELFDEIMRRTALYKNRPISELFAGFINKRLSQVVMKSAGIDIAERAEILDKKAVSNIVGTIKNWNFKVTGTTGFENAQVTAGGAQTTQFFDNLMSKKCKGLFAIGEVLNVDGDCGGFNLAFAWASAAAAAKGVNDYLKDFLK